MGAACCRSADSAGKKPVDTDEVNIQITEHGGSGPIANGDVQNESDSNGNAAKKSVQDQNQDDIRDTKLEIPSQSQTEPVDDATILKAMFDYTARQHDDLQFKKDDRFELLDGGDTAGWWKAKHLQSGHVGYVPSTYVVKDDDNVTSYDWWFNMKRQDANKQLLLPGNPDGTFLVRESTESNTFALSIRWFDPDNPLAQGIRHYKIRFEENGNKCFINPKITFTNVVNLIKYYKENIGLVCKLLKACPNIPEPVPFKDLEIDRESLVLMNKLGHGNFGEVFKGKWRRSVEVAVKTLKPNSMSPEAFLAEAEIMHKLRHHKLVILMGICSKEEPMYIITELMINGSLRDYLREKKTEVKFMTLIYMATQIAEGMSYLEKEKFVHRDVRAANMLVGENNITKVADFGLARVIEDDEYNAQSGTKFPVKWTAIEAIHEQNFSVKSDVWSFGVLLYEMFTQGMTPFIGLSNRETIDKLDKGYRMPKPVRFDFPDDIYEQMKRCWDMKPDKRPAFTELHTFFEKYEEPNYELEGDADVTFENDDDVNKYDD